jgi:hypothetical protein
VKAYAIAAAAIACTPAMASPIEFPAPPGVTWDNPQSWEGGRPKWSDIPDFAFECENGDTITVSHRRGSVTFEKSGSEYKIDGSNAVYQNVPDRFGNQQEAIFITLIEGGPSTHPTWELADGQGSMWFFSEAQRPRQILKCLPK